MSRQRRVLFPGAVYHVTARGNERQPIYLESVDRLRFLELLALGIERCGWLCHGYCLMGNHYHLLIETPRPNLPEGMRHLNGCYAQDFNRRRHRAGHLFQGRYKAVLVDKESHLLELVRYIALNPVRADLRGLPEEWPWSGYRALLGLAPKPAWLTTDWVLGQLSDVRALARVRLKAFVDDAVVDLTPLPVRGGLFLAGDDFIRANTGDPARIEEVPRAQWQPLRPTLAEIFATDPDPIAAAYRTWGYTLREIGGHVGRHYTTISRRLQRSERTARS